MMGKSHHVNPDPQEAGSLASEDSASREEKHQAYRDIARVDAPKVHPLESCDRHKRACAEKQNFKYMRQNW